MCSKSEGPRTSRDEKRRAQHNEGKGVQFLDFYFLNY